MAARGDRSASGAAQLGDFYPEALLLVYGGAQRNWARNGDPGVKYQPMTYSERLAERVRKSLSSTKGVVEEEDVWQVSLYDQWKHGLWRPPR